LEGGQILTKKTYTSIKIIASLCLLLITFPNSYQAYTDLSTYRIETGKFLGEYKAKKALEELQNDTGWTGTYKSTSDYLEYYRISSGLYTGEDKVKSVLQLYKNNTGLDGSYVGTGDQENYYKLSSGLYTGESKVKSVVQELRNTTGIEASYVGAGESENYYKLSSGLYTGESKVKMVLREFQNQTGIKGNYVGIGTPENYYQISSGLYTGESKAKRVLQDFENTTGIEGTYIGAGNLENYYQIISGGFSGEARVKQILQEFESTTGINANYEVIGNETYRIKSDPVLGKTVLSKGLDYFKSKNWWVTYQSTGKKGYEKYLIKSNPVLGLSLVNKGREFFKSNNWSSTYESTGQKGYAKYMINSEPVLGMKSVNKGIEFFKSNNWSVTYESTGQKAYAKYMIISKPLLGLEMVNKGVKFFKSNNWSVTYEPTGQKGYAKYIIYSVPLLGKERVNKGLEFFKSNNWSATYRSTGQKQYYYEILINDFNGYDKAEAAIQKINQLYGWYAIAVKTKNGPQLMYTDYGITLSSMLEKQMLKYPQTDMYRNDRRFVSADFVDMTKQIITGNGVNLRTTPSIDGTVVQQLNTGDEVLVIGKTGDWVEVRLTWQNAFASDVKQYLDPNNFSINNKEYFQFLKLSKPANLSASEVNEKILKGKGILAGKGQAFIDAAKKYNINDVYLISHALLETGNGTSKLATGVVVNGKTVYNMFGYGAVDSCPITCGAQTAYDKEWFTPEAAIIGGAQFISSDYIYNVTFRQDTLYKMRWNPVQQWHQYATDIGWAYKQVDNIYNLYQLLDNYTLYYDTPKYR
jgi:mannosyl-glycoprotein endo-beta-N-acetylglucosaminidase